MRSAGSRAAAGSGRGEVFRFSGIPRRAQATGSAASCQGGRPGSSAYVNVCHGQAGTTAGRADFGPDYQSPSHASLRPRRLCAPSHVTPGEGRHPWPTGRNHVPEPGEVVTSLVRALALHGVAMLRSHLASPLRPGRGVLIRSVSRRLGSVACVREDASPNEVSLSNHFRGCPIHQTKVNSKYPQNPTTRNAIIRDQYFRDRIIRLARTKQAPAGLDPDSTAEPAMLPMGVQVMNALVPFSKARRSHSSVGPLLSFRARPDSSVGPLP